MRADQYPLLVAIVAVFVLVPLLLWELVAVPFTGGAITFRARLDGCALRAETGGGPEGEDLLGDSTMTEHELAMLAQRLRNVGVWSVARLRDVDGAPYAMFANADSVAQLRDRLPHIASLLAQLER